MDIGEGGAVGGARDCQSSLVGAALERVGVVGDGRIQGKGYSSRIDYTVAVGDGGSTNDSSKCKKQRNYH